MALDQAVADYEKATILNALNNFEGHKTKTAAACGFRSIPITDSGPFRSLIPAQTDHRFRSKLDSDSGWEPITFSVRTGTLQGS